MIVHEIPLTDAELVTAAMVAIGLIKNDAVQSPDDIRALAEFAEVALELADGVED